MSWRSRYREASFRGVSFKVEAHETTIGRQVVLHEYPNRSLPYAEDLGRKARSFKIEAFILGDNYDIDRNALFNAIEQEGPGELIHPSYGTLTVICKPSNVSEEVGLNRIAKFSLEFTEVGEKRYPDSSSDGLSLIDKLADEVLDAATQSFENNFSVEGVQQYVKDDALSLFEKATQNIEKVVGAIEQAEDSAASSASRIDRFKRDIFGLISSPGKAAQRYRTTLDVLSSTRNYKKLFLGLRSFYRFDDGQSNPASRPSRSQRIFDKNRSSLNAFIKTAGIANSAKAGARASLPVGVEGNGFDSVNEATQLRDELMSVLDSTLENTDDDSLYLSLQDLRNQIRKSIPDESTRLKHLRVFSPSKTLPSLVLAYDLLGDASKEQDMVDRNAIVKPGFIPSGSSLEVIANG